MTQSTMDRLLASPQGFNLFQAISLLERAEASETAAAPVRASNQQRAEVRLSAFVSLSFEPSDIRAVVSPAAIGAPYVVRTPVMSLAGAGGPLPQPFTELVLERSAKRDHATADFLDIFNHRLLTFLYHSRRKHHVSLDTAQPSRTSLASTLDSISALGRRSGVRAPDNSTQWLRHAGLLGGAPRSMVGLIAVLRDRLKIPVDGTQFRGHWRTLESDAIARLHTGSGQGGVRLGRAAVLGRRVWDQGAGLNLQFTGMSQQRLHGLLPGGSDHALAQWLVRRYVPQDIDVRMTLRLAPTESRPSTLSATNPMRLGWTSWVAGRVSRRPLAPVTLKLTRTGGV